ncbi:MAG: hypothetical protein D6680_14975 [Cyanobacteria bacterium J007]|nr:MAG: hypothetical protein D6680_14975 [Cyanobacteria bacterium J007]
MSPRFQRLGLLTSVLAIALANPTPARSTPVRSSMAPSVASISSLFAQGEWQQFTSPDRRFSILMPGIPEEENRSGNNGTSRMFMLEKENGNVAYGVGYIEFPNVPDSLTPVQIDQLLDAARDGGVGNVENGRLRQERRISLQNNPGKEFEVQSTQGIVKTRIYWVEPRLYVILVASSSDRTFPRDADRFLNSFNLERNQALNPGFKLSFNRNF